MKDKIINYIAWAIIGIIALPFVVVIGGVILAIICALLAIVFVVGLAVLPFALAAKLLT